MDRVRARVVVSGRVQGVAFRASTRHMAQGLGLSGWVKNLASGDVEAAFEGPKEAVEAALAWCHHGPPSARVISCDITREPPGDSPHPFEIRHS